MTKEQFLNKWAFKYNVNYTTNPYLIDDLEAVIATEIAKVWELEPVQGIPQPELNPIEQAYHAFQPIRPKSWPKDEWVKKQGETESIDNKGRLWGSNWNFDTNPEEWELYTEPTEQPSSQAKLDNSFDKERFEAMFRAVVANGGHELDHKQAIELTEEALKQLDAYYASKEGGSND